MKFSTRLVQNDFLLTTMSRRHVRWYGFGQPEAARILRQGLPLFHQQAGGQLLSFLQPWPRFLYCDPYRLLQSGSA